MFHIQIIYEVFPMKKIINKGSFVKKFVNKQLYFSIISFIILNLCLSTCDDSTEKNNKLPLNPPSNLHFTDSSHTHISLSWSDNSMDEDGFIIERMDGSGFIVISTIETNITSFIDSGLTPGTTYVYRICSFRGSTLSEYSNESSITTKTYLEPPSNLHFTDSSHTHISLSWSDNSMDEDGFIIERKVGSEFIVISTIETNIISFIDSGLTPDTAYIYRIRAFKDSTFSEYSNESYITTLFQGWKPIGCGMGGNTYWLSIDPNNDNVLYYSPDVGGLYKTTNGGRTWKRIAAEFLHNHRGSTTSMTTIAPSNSDYLYVWARMRIGDLHQNAELVQQYGRNHLGLIKSMDGGVTWDAIKGPPHRLGAIAIDPDDENTVWAAGPGFQFGEVGYRDVHFLPGSGALTRTTNGGDDWYLTYIGCDPPTKPYYTHNNDCFDKQVAFGSIVVDPSSPYGNRTLYICGTKGVHKSTDNGSTWTEANNGLPLFSTSLVSDNTQLIDSSYAQMMTLHWDELTDIKTILVTFSGHSDIDGGIYRTTDDGETWENITGNLGTNPGFRFIEVNKDNPNIIYVGMRYDNGSDDGLFKTINGGESWERITWPYGFLANGHEMNKDMENCWNQTRKDRVEGLAISQQDPNIIYYCDGNCRMFSTNNAGESWNQIYTNNITDGGRKLFQTRGMDSTFIRALKTSPHDPNTIMIGEHDYCGWCSHDGGETFTSTQVSSWQEFDGIGFRAPFFSVAFDPNDPEYICGAASIGNNGYLYFSTDRGWSWGSNNDTETWPKKLMTIDATSIHNEVHDETNIEGINLTSLSLIILNNGRILLTKKSGLFYSDDKGDNWNRVSPINTGIKIEDAFVFYRLYSRIESVNNEEREVLYSTSGIMPVPLSASENIYDYGTLNSYVRHSPSNMLGGIYKSEDNGNTWSRINSDHHWASVSSIAFDPDNENIIYIATKSWYHPEDSPHGYHMYDGGLYKSEDKGVTWNNMFNCTAVPDIVLSDDSIFIVAHNFPGQISQGGIYRSRDGGETWEDVTGIAALHSYSHLAVNQFNPKIIYVGTNGAGAYMRTFD